MLDVRGLANSVSNTINDNEIVTVQPSDGYTLGAGARQIPRYGSSVTGPAQIQALNNKDLKLIEQQNIQTTILALYLRGGLYGVVRPDSKGGDLVTRADGSQWLVTIVLESWPTWTKVGITRQGGNQ
jgi:hypothetical protein